MSEHDHEGGPGENVRMDILKVNQKIFNLYPMGSEERKNCIRNKKLTELDSLNAAMHNMPAESVSLISQMNSHLVIFGLLKAGVAGLVLTYTPTAWRWVGNVYGKIAVACLTGATIAYLIDNLTKAWTIYKERKLMLKEYAALRSKFDALMVDLEELK